MLDLGTGTGAIALAIASERPGWEIIATDISDAALKIAEKNCQNLGLQNVFFVQSDWYSAISGRRFDLIISNPPYIKEQDPHLIEGDVRFEPQSTLVAGCDGLDDIRQIISGAGENLQPGGCLAIEHGFDQGDEVRTLLRQAGYEAIKTCRDLAGHERASVARLSGIS